MTRTVKIKLELTANKLRKLLAVEQRFLSAVNRYVVHLWENGGSLNKETADVVPLGHLPFNFRAAALQQALAVVAAARASERETGNNASCPVVRKGIRLNQRTVTIELNKPTEAFDIWFKISTLKSGKRIWLPGRRHKVLNKWLAKPGAELAKGCELQFTKRGAFAIVWVKVPDLELRSKGDDLGVDVGVNTVLATSKLQSIGRNFKAVADKVRACRPGSKGRARAHVARDRYLNWCVNQLPWSRLKSIAVEDLKGLKTGKKKHRGKQFRKLLAPWRYASVQGRMEQKAQENCVLFQQVPPAYTSQLCPVCGHCASVNRVNEKFCCVRCGHSANADHVGAQNILTQALGRVSSPRAADAGQPAKDVNPCIQT